MVPVFIVRLRFEAILIMQISINFHFIQNGHTTAHALAPHRRPRRSTSNSTNVNHFTLPIPSIKHPHLLLARVVEEKIGNLSSLHWTGQYRGSSSSCQWPTFAIDIGSQQRFFQPHGRTHQQRRKNNTRHPIQPWIRHTRKSVHSQYVGRVQDVWQASNVKRCSPQDMDHSSTK